LRVLVTGCSGSLAGALIPLLLEEGHDVVGVSRDEYKQSLIPKRERLSLYLADVRDRDRLLEASRGVELVFHAAAMKRIECCDEQPEEAAGINIGGTQNVLFCQRMNKIPRVVLVSTDKACLPITSYGASKFMAERLVLRNPNNMVVRYGNVLGSRGSVLQLFSESIRKDGIIQVTDTRCSRFWWTLQDAATWIYLCSQRPKGGLQIPNLKAYPVVGLGRALADVLGAPRPQVVEIGLRGWEKIHEDMRTAEEGGAMQSGDQSLWFSQSEMRETIQRALT